MDSSVVTIFKQHGSINKVLTYKLVTHLMEEHVRAINNLCKLVDSLIGTSFKPEHLRLCKLNKVNSEEEKLIRTVIHKLCCCSARVDICNVMPEECVAQCLLAQGGAISYQWSPESSGRQLLMCLGYIIANGALEKIINHLILKSPLGVEILPSPEAVLEQSDLPLKPEMDSDETRQNYINMLATKIHHNLKAISNFRQERAKLCSKVHLATSGFRGLPHLSVGDLQLINSPDRVQQFLASCQPCLRAIKAYTRWQASSNLFWKWMESVLKEEELVNKKQPLSVVELTHLSTFLRKLEKFVRDTALTEVCAEYDANEHLSIMRMSVTDSVKPLQGVIEVLDTKIETISRSNDKKKQELRRKLLSSKISSSEVETLVKVIDGLVLTKDSGI